MGKFRAAAFKLNGISKGAENTHATQRQHGHGIPEATVPGLWLADMARGKRIELLCPQLGILKHTAEARLAKQGDAAKIKLRHHQHHKPGIDNISRLTKPRKHGYNPEAGLGVGKV
jgi:hypothetical protein